MKKQEVTRNYSFSDAFLIQKCDDVSGSVTRDQTDFTDRGFSAADNTAFKEQSEDFGELPTDEELEGAVSDATEIKDEKAEDVRVSIRMFRTAAENKWGVKKAKYRIYGFDGMDDLNESDLVRLGKRVGRVANAQLADIGNGITDAKIIAHNAKVNALDDAIDAKEEAVKARDIATEDRIEAGNALYAVLVKVCNTGKDIWVTRDEAKYNDYVIYDTPSGGPEPPPTPPV